MAILVPAVTQVQAENLRWHEKIGYRAEVRRERKKRDILSPVNVL